MAGRRALEDVTSPHPMAPRLPAVLREAPPGRSSFVDGFCTALDSVLAPVFVTLDGLEAYVDPQLAPADFLPWLRTWVGLSEEVALPEAASRAFVREAAELYRWQGTTRALRRLVEIYADGEVQVRDNGGSVVAGEPADVRFEREPPLVHVRVRTSRAGDPQFLRGLRSIVAAAAPAHVVTDVEVLPA